MEWYEWHDIERKLSFVILIVIWACSLIFGAMFAFNNIPLRIIIIEFIGFACLATAILKKLEDRIEKVLEKVK